MWGKGGILPLADTMERAAHVEDELFPVYLSTGEHVLNLNGLWHCPVRYHKLPHST
jgi:hypothetical protein